MKTYVYRSVTLTSYTGGGESSKPVLSPFGPVRAGLTTSQTTRDQALTELLNSLESVVASLNSKSFTALDTLDTAIQGVRVALYSIVTDEAGTDTL